MNFNELKKEIYDRSGLDFQTATDQMQELIFALDTADTIELISEIGAIPEEIGHDSTEEKLYTKVSDILLAKAFKELNLESMVLSQRADCADVIVQSHFHKYSLVGDAKAFRLSRTARNAKDYKVKSMDNWRGDCDYSVLVCPYFHYPKNNSQIYKEALDVNVSLFSWEYIYILLKEGIKESPAVNLCRIWNQSEIIGSGTTVSNAKHCFLPAQNANLASILNIDIDKFYKYFNQIKSVIIQRGHSEIEYYKREVNRIKQLNRDEAIAELLRTMKFDSKIETIRNFIDKISSAVQ